VAIVGGGITGLAAAHRLVELSASRGVAIDLTLLEAGDRLGGTITTERVEGYLIEGGPDSFLTEKPWAGALCDRLGLGESLRPTRDAHRRTFIVHRSRLEPLPEGFQVLAPSRLGSLWQSPLLSWRGKLRMAMELVIPRAREGGDESVGAFVDRRLGGEALERIAQPLVSAIYTGDPWAISMAATMPRFLEMERRHGSVIRALRHTTDRRGRSASGPRWGMFVTLAGGLTDLVHALARRMPPRAVELGRRVTSLARPAGPLEWRVGLADGAAISADGVILAVPAPAAARLLWDTDAALSRMLAAIPYVSSALVTLAYRAEAVGRLPAGFGFVVPDEEGRTILACTFSSVKFADRAPEGDVLLRVFIGGRRQQGLLDADDSTLAAVAEGEIKDLLAANAPPRLVRVHRHRASMPLYLVGHLERAAAIRARAAHHRGLALAGNALGGVGLSDCVRSGEEAAEQMLEALRGDTSITGDVTAAAAALGP
jgi:oxygen-dependent protoporphyrinogen oxidase